MEHTQLQHLWQQYLDDKLPPAELPVLLEMLRNEAHPEALLQPIDQALAGNTYAQPVDEEDKNRIFQSILQQAALQEGATKVVPIRKRLSPWKAVAAAVVLLLTITVSYRLLYNRHTPNNITATDIRFRYDHQPGGNKAILTLADGSSVTLDSTSGGILAKQNGTNVLQQKAGEIAYDPSAQASTTVVYNTVTTPRGGQFQIMLPDGSHVWLNAASSIRFPTTFTGTTRKVELTGEAYFEVAQNPSQPFTVTVAGVAVKVLGTHFNINAYNDEPAVNTTLLEGSVMVAHQGKEAIIKPGQQASVKEGITVKDHVDIDALMAWKNGRFSYNEMDIHGIMRQISRWYDVDVVFEDNINDSYTMEISRNVPLSKLLKFMEISGGAHFEMKEKKIIVRK
ncbi:MAG: FecR domain-containing protein [Chitinophaga sp.]|uniref:FecR family protein n=1 Tax=Chitinophaga sp. TaxID=1869181 RepID=UPI0025BD40ED|nr:FecR family protein [Chitinophaga sp.]MBV8253968.1 FecR domain-containing protein [Chitinophaga sp.]